MENEETYQIATKNNLLDNPGKLLISNLRSNPQTQTWKLSIMSAISLLPLDLAWSAGVCKGYQNEWQKTLSHFEFWNVSSKHQRGFHCSSLSDSLSHQKNHPSLSVRFVFSSSLWFAKQRVSEEIPYFALERQMRGEERWRKEF